MSASKTEGITAEDLIRLARVFKTQNRIGLQLGIAEATLRKLAKRLGVHLPNYSNAANAVPRETKRDMAEMLSRGFMLHEVSFFFGMSVPAVFRATRSIRWMFTKGKHMSIDDHQFRAMAQRMSLNQIAEELNYSRSMIQRWAQRLNIESEGAAGYKTVAERERAEADIAKVYELFAAGWVPTQIAQHIKRSKSFVYYHTHGAKHQPDAVDDAMHSGQGRGAAAVKRHDWPKPDTTMVACIGERRFEDVQVRISSARPIDGRRLAAKAATYGCGSAAAMCAEA